MLNKKKNPNLTLIVIAISYYAIYNLQLMKSLYYSSVQYGFAINNTQIGQIFSVCGILSMVAYLCGTLFQSRFTTKFLMVGSLIIIGSLSLILMFIPPYPVLLIIFGAAGFLVNATFYPAYLTVMQNVGGQHHQGEAFAKFYIFSSILGSGFALIAFQLTSYFRDPVMELRALLLYFTVLNLMGALGITLFLPAIPIPEKTGRLFDKWALQQILGNKQIWLAVLIIFANYVNFSNLTYTLPYLSNKFDLPSGLVNLITILRVYILVLLAAPIAGKITDRMHTAIHLIKGSFLLYAIVIFLMVWLFSDNALGTIACIIGICFFVPLGKSMSLVLISETDLPPYLSGLALSIVSFLAYSPDAFYYYISGWVLDQFPDRGYLYVFAISGVIALIGMAAAIAFHKIRNAQDTYPH